MVDDKLVDLLASPSEEDEVAKGVRSPLNRTALRVPHSRRIIMGNTIFRVYSIGFLAMITGRSRISFYKWEEKRILPKSIFSIPGCYDRFYTAAEIFGYAKIIADVKPGSGKNPNLLNYMAILMRQFHDALQAEMKVYSEQVISQNLSLEEKMAELYQRGIKFQKKPNIDRLMDLVPPFDPSKAPVQEWRSNIELLHARKKQAHENTTTKKGSKKAAPSKNVRIVTKKPKK